jgi:hypothetical protein
MKRIISMGFFYYCAVTLLIIPSIFSFSEGSQEKSDRMSIDTALLINTFLGGNGTFEYAKGIAVDGSGNIYVVGSSHGAWGTPIIGFAGDVDGFVVKLNANGVLQWHTFLGGTDEDYCGDITLDGSGNVYVVGTSKTTWGTPRNPYTGGREVFIAKLDSNGNLLGNTFMGSIAADNGNQIACDMSGNVYVTGTSSDTWGTPINGYSGGSDAFVVKINSSGNVQWSTFMGSANHDGGDTIALDGSGNVYVAGTSNATWGTPNVAYGGDDDFFVAKLSNSGSLQWNTFTGMSDRERSAGIALDISGNIYVAGRTTVLPPTGDWEAHVLKLDNNGLFGWDLTFGSASSDQAWGIDVDTSGFIYVTGVSAAAWGSPIEVHNGGSDAFIAKINSSGVLQWNTFAGSAGSDVANPIVLDSSGTIYLAGYSAETWGTPVNPHTGDGMGDAFVAMFSIEPDINVEFRSDRIPDGVNVNLGTRPASLIMGQDLIFTIENLGVLPLDLTGIPAVTLSGPQASHFYVSSQPTSPIAPSSTTIFTVRTVRDSLPGFLPIGWMYPVSITVNIPNSDPDENPYDFTINFMLEKDI